MPVIRSCPACGKSNRIPAKHLSDTGKCGACKAPLPAMAEPIEVGAEEFDEVIREIQEQGITEEELAPVKVKLRAEFYSNLEGGMGAHMPRFGLMHFLACFTLFDGDPNRINTVLEGFQAVTAAQVQAAAKKYLVPRNRAILVRQPVAKAAAR